MRRGSLLALSTLTLLLVLAGPALAFEPRAGAAVIVSGTIDDDLYASGRTVDVTGTVNGDVVAAGSTVRLTGQTAGGVLAAGGSVRIGGRVGRTVRAAAGTVTLTAAVAGDAVLGGGTVEVEQDATIDRDLVAGGGTVRVAGTVGRNAQIGGGQVVIAGTIRGDSRVVADRLVVTSTGRILGRLRYSTEEPIEIQQGAQVGVTERIVLPKRPRSFGPVPRVRYGGRLLEWIWLFALGAVILAVAPAASRRAVDRIRGQFPATLLVGFLLLVAVPVAVVLALITIAGVPLGIALFLLYLATLYPSQVFAATWLGDEILRAVGTQAPSPYLSLLVGTALLVIVVAAPFVGWLVRLAALLVGFGALWGAIWLGTRTRPAQPASGT